MSNLQQQINNLKDKMLKDLAELHKLEEQLKNEPKHKNGWERKGLDRYYIDNGINVKSASGFISQYMDELDRNNSLFSTKELAEDILKEEQCYRTIRRWRDTHDNNWEDLNFNDGMQDKYYITYCYSNKELYLNFDRIHKNLNTIYFSSEELAEQCMEENRQLLEKYFNKIY